MSADFGGAGSRRKFAERLLAEAAQRNVFDASNLLPGLLSAPLYTPVLAADRLPVLTSAGPTLRRATATTLRDYVLGIVGGVAIIPESLRVDTDALTVNATTNRVGINVATASTTLSLDVVSAFGVRPSTSINYPTVLAGGAAGRFYAIADAGTWGFVVGRYSTTAGDGADLAFYRTRSLSGDRTVLVDGDVLGNITFQGPSQTGGTVNNGAMIRAIVNGAVSNGVLPTDLAFHTVASGDAYAVTARWILRAAGHWVPATNNSFDVGTTALRVRAIYSVGLDLSGNSVFGDATTDTLTFTARAISDLIPSTTDARSLGSTALRWANVWATTFTGTTATLSGNATIGGTLGVTGATTLSALLNINHANGLQVSGVKVVGVQGAAVIDATDAASAITQLNALLARARAHGLIAT